MEAVAAAALLYFVRTGYFLDLIVNRVLLTAVIFTNVRTDSVLAEYARVYRPLQ